MYALALEGPFFVELSVAGVGCSYISSLWPFQSGNLESAIGSHCSP